MPSQAMQLLDAEQAPCPAWLHSQAPRHPRRAWKSELPCQPHRVQQICVPGGTWQGWFPEPGALTRALLIAQGALPGVPNTPQLWQTREGSFGNGRGPSLLPGPQEERQAWDFIEGGKAGVPGGALGRARIICPPTR